MLGIGSGRTARRSRPAQYKRGGTDAIPPTQHNHLHLQTQYKMHPNYHPGQPFGGYYRYSRGPSRIWWFLLGAGAFAAWNYMHKTDSERRRFGWNRERCVKGRDQDHPADTRGRRDDVPAAVAQNQGPEYGSPGSQSRNDAEWGSEPLWRLRSEKEAERLKTARDIEVREQLLNAREKVCKNSRTRY